MVLIMSVSFFRPVPCCTSTYTCRRYYVYYAPAGHEALVLRAQPSVGQIDLYVLLIASHDLDRSRVPCDRRCMCFEPLFRVFLARSSSFPFRLSPFSFCHQVRRAVPLLHRA